MLIVADIKSLEVVTAAELSGDEVLREEVRNKVPFHDLNMARFKLPNRTIAKIFMFKLIYGATAWGYANDGDFTEVSRSEDFWQGIIDTFYAKYRGLKRWHEVLVETAIKSGRYITPSGREYHYPSSEISGRLWYWRPKILNYPVQGFGADLVMLSRIAAFNRIRKAGLDCRFISSVHDSIVVDSDPKLCYNVGSILKQSVIDTPENFRRIFKKDFSVPMTAEIKVGKDLKNMEVLDC